MYYDVYYKLKAVSIILCVDAYMMMMVIDDDDARLETCDVCME